MSRATAEELLSKHYIPEPNSGCWLWTGGVNRKGYGLVKGTSAHRASYIVHVGPIPEGLQIDHLCRVRCCINPKHLEAVTLQENVRRSTVGEWQSRKTHCPQGHEYTEENTVWKTKRGNPARSCRTCGREECRSRRARAKLMRSGPCPS